MTTLNRFRGVDNTNAPETLFEIERGQATTFLPEAVNVDITDAFKLVRRRGFTQVLEGRWHSLWPDPAGGAFAVRDGSLVRLSPSLAVTDLGISFGDRPLAFARVNHEVFFSDGQNLGVFDGTAQLLARGGSYERTAQYLDAAEDEGYFDSPPPGTILEFAFGRLWVVDAYGVWYSRPFFPRRFNLENDFIPWEGVTLFRAVADGFYLGTSESVFFLMGRDPKTFQIRTVSNAGAVARTALACDGAKFRIEGVSGDVCVWESRDGKMLGASGGRVVRLSERVSYGVSDTGASILREQNGQTHHLSTFPAPGEASNMRASDIAVAEVRRNGVLI